MELRDIEYFAVIAEHGHLGRAAAALGLSQPALSKSLQRLQNDLQVLLVKRTPHGVELTAEGAALQLRVRELRLSLQSVAREIKEVSKGLVGHLRIGVGTVISEHFLAVAFAKLLEYAPRIIFKVSVSDNDLMVPALVNGELDLVINYYAGSSRVEGILYEHLYEDNQVVCAAANHRLARKKNVSLRDLADERWACAEASLASQQTLHERFRSANLPPPRAGLECRSTSLRLRTVMYSDLLDFTAQSAVQQFASDLVKILPVKELAWRRSIGLMRRNETYTPPAVLRFIEIIKTAAKDIALMSAPVAVDGSSTGT